MPKPLVIVESPTKARTIAGYLGPDFVVESSLGNIRDLPRNAAEIPSKFKGEAWAALGVDVTKDFDPVYVVPAEKKAQVRKLKGLLKDASELFLATDEDREGEAIAWHLAEELKPDVPVRRMVFDEITRSAILRAVEAPRELDLQLVAAQETRRILDRLYGYEVSPVLWKKVLPGLSAGRVQSVFVRIIVERELERIAFREASWWNLEGAFAPTERTDETFAATLVAVDGKRLATGKDFSPQGELDRDDVVRLDEEGAHELAEAIRDADFTVRTVEEKPYKLSPHAPFMTSTLQQEGGRKLGFNVARTMRAAQRLYENGYITYMRTDSTTLSESAVRAARDLARELYGADYVPDKARVYQRKSRNAQEAHEAIRPSGERFRTPEQVAREVDGDEARLYELIWKRTVASQMADARGQSVQARLGAGGSRDAEFAASGRTIEFAGFLRAYVEGSDDPEADLEDRQRFLPRLSEGEALTLSSLEAAGHTTKPPARFTEPALIKVVEEMGVGRPSTYASMVSTIQDRGYVWKKGQALVPSWTAFAVVALLKRYFPDLVDYEFTARMEDVLDEISNGEEQPKPWLQRFYHGNGQPGLKDLVSQRLDEIDAREINSISLGEAPDGEPVVVRVGRYGPYVSHRDDTASIPDDLPPDEVGVAKALELIELQAKSERPLGEDDETDLPIYVRSGRYGPYVQLGPIGEDPQKTASLFKTMDPQTLTLDDAKRLLSLPRVVGEHPEGGQIESTNGRYGPYVRWEKETRSLDDEEQIFTITVERAVELLAQPKARGRRREVPTLRDLGEDPETKKAVALKEGRYGPYVTDGEVNASLQRGDDPASVSIERASELLAERRAKGPGKRGKKTTAKKKTAPKKKTSPKRKSSAKSSAKRSSAKKPKGGNPKAS